MFIFSFNILKTNQWLTYTPAKFSGWESQLQLTISSVWSHKRNRRVLVLIFLKNIFIFDGFLWFRIDFQKCKQSLEILKIFRNCRILTKTDNLGKNFFLKHASELQNVLACNSTNWKSNMTPIRDGLTFRPPVFPSTPMIFGLCNFGLGTGAKTRFCQTCRYYFENV